MGRAVGGAGRAVRLARAHVGMVRVVLVVATEAAAGVMAPGVVGVATVRKGPWVRASVSSPS